MATENKRMRQLQATDAEWGQVNPVLLDGEIAFSSDIRKFKVGPGTWASLPYWDETITSFLRLSDTPPDYAGAAGKLLFVNQSETGIEFVTGSGAWVAKSGDTMTGPLIMDFPVTEEAAMIVEGGTAFALDSRRDGDMWWDMSNAQGTLLHGRIGYKNNVQALRLRSYGPGGDTDIANSLYVGRDDVWVTGTGTENPDANSVQTRERADFRYTRWVGPWVSGTTYENNQQVRSGGYLAIANQTTTENPAPVPIGDPEYLYTGTNPTTAITAKTLEVMTEYTFPEALALSRYRVYTVTGNVYSIQYRLDDGPIVQVRSFTAASTGWDEFVAAEVIIPEGSKLAVSLLMQEPDPSPIVVTANYDYQTPQNTTTPLEGQITHARGQADVMQINNIDNDGTDRTAMLQSLTPGDIIDSGGLRWAIQKVTSVPLATEFVVAPATVDSIGVKTFSFETTAATPITTLVDTDFYLTVPNVTSAFSVDGADPVFTDDAYAVDIEVQRVEISDHWELQAVSGNGVTGGNNGGGVSSFLQLTDTPANYGGQGNRVVRVKANEEGLEFFDGQWVERTGDTMTGPLKMIIGDSETPAFEVSGGSAYVSRGFRDGDQWHDFWNAAGDSIYARMGYDISNEALRLRSYVGDSSGATARTLYIGQEDVWITGTGTEVPDPNSVITAERGDVRYGGGVSRSNIGWLNNIDGAINRYMKSKQGAGGGNVVQDFCVDPFRGELYTLHVTATDPETSVINQYDSDGPRTGTSTRFTPTSTNLVGHQGLTICWDAAGVRWFFAAGRKDRGTYNQEVQLFQIENGTGTDLDITNAATLTLIASGDPDLGTGSITTAASLCGRYLVTTHTNDSKVGTVLVFDMPALLAGGAGDYSGQELIRFQTDRIYVSADNPLQGVACDGQYIYLFAGDADLANPNTVDVYTMGGSKVHDIADFQIGRAEALGDGLGTDYEMEGADWVWHGGEPYLGVLVASGDSGARTNRVWAMGAHKPVQGYGWGDQPAFMATGTNDFGAADGEALNFGRYSATNGTWDQWVKIDGDQFQIDKQRIEHRAWDGIHTRYLPPISGSGDQFADYGNDDGSLIYARAGYDFSETAYRLRTHIGGDTSSVGISAYLGETDFWATGLGTTVTSGDSILTADRADNRYLLLTGGTMPSQLHFDPAAGFDPSDASATASVRFNTSALTPGQDLYGAAMVWSRLSSGRPAAAISYKQTAGDDARGGFAFFTDDIATNDDIVREVMLIDHTGNLELHEASTSSKLVDNSVYTRGMNDARYLQLAGGAMTGALTFNRTSASNIIMNRDGGDQYIDFRKGDGTFYGRMGWFNGSTALRFRAYDGQPTNGTAAEIDVRTDGDIRVNLGDFANFPSSTSVASRNRGDNRWGRKTTGTIEVTARDSADPAGGTASPTLGTGTFARVGEIIYVEFTFTNIDTTGMTGANNIYFHMVETSSTGRFSTNVQGRAYLHFLANQFTRASGYDTAMGDAKDGYVVIRETGSANTNIIANVEQFTSGTADIYISGTYRI